MVEPCSTSSSAGIRQCARLKLSATPRVGSAGTVEVLEVTMRPSTQPTRSVKVPPISIPTTFIIPFAFIATATHSDRHPEARVPLHAPRRMKGHDPGRPLRGLAYPI